MSEWIEFEKDEQHVARERAKARELRKSQWWRQQLQRGVCHYCGQEVGATNLTLDHVVPVARGGSSTKGNVVPACQRCNAEKRCQTPAEIIFNQLEAQRGATDTTIQNLAVMQGGGGKRLVVVAPHGFCSGVARAVEMAEAVLEKYAGETIYCLNEIVHNRHVVESLVKKGMVFIKSVEEVPMGARLLFSAHGVAPTVVESAAARHLKVVDATCPFVMKVHAAVRRFAKAGACVVCIGHRNHEEVIGVAGEAPESVVVVENASQAKRLEVEEGRRVAVVTQTTLGQQQVESVMRVLKRRFPDLSVSGAADVCYATSNRQEAVLALTYQCGHILVLGGENSSNSQRLVETARRAGAVAKLVSTVEELDDFDFSVVSALGITSGASTPESFLHEVVEVLVERFGFEEPELFTAIEEDMPQFSGKWVERVEEME